MKQIFYQKLLISIAIVAFFGTMATSQVINRTSVTSQLSQQEKREFSKKVTKSPEGKQVTKKVVSTLPETVKQNKPEQELSLGESILTESELKQISANKRQTIDKPTQRLDVQLTNKMESKRRPQQSDNKTPISVTDKTLEERKQDIIDKMNAADNEEDIKKYKAILDSLK